MARKSHKRPDGTGKAVIIIAVPPNFGASNKLRWTKAKLAGDLNKGVVLNQQMCGWVKILPKVKRNRRITAYPRSVHLEYHIY